MRLSLKGAACRSSRPRISTRNPGGGAEEAALSSLSNISQSAYSSILQGLLFVTAREPGRATAGPYAPLGRQCGYFGTQVRGRAE
jgi:hypothetical protein